MPSGIPEPLILERNGKKEWYPSIRSAWLKKLRGPNDSETIIGQRNRNKKVRAAIENHIQINGYFIYYDKT
jgi:hypothetical protein